MIMIVIDGEGQILGRLASYVAKELLKGNEVVVFNCDGIVVTGNPKNIKERFKEKRDRGDPHHGPYYPRRSDGIFRRSVRGMLPRKKARGREAFKRLKVYKGNPLGLEGIKVSKTKDEITCKSLTLAEITKVLGD